MAPVSNINGEFLAMSKRWPEPATTRTSPPTRASMTLEGGFLEAWAQGYNVGSFIVLILIVLCNYRSGILLHKLILLEVRPNPVFSLKHVLISKASPRNLARNLYLLRGPALWMVLVIHRHAPLHLLLPAQCRRLAQNPAIPPTLGLSILHHLSPLRATLLDRRSLVQLCLL